LDFRVPIAPTAAATMFKQGSGLLTNSVQVRVPAGGGTVQYVRVLISGLGNDSLGNPIRVQNAAGNLNGVPFVLYPGPLAPGQVITLPIQYHASDRTTVPSPQFTVQAVSIPLTPPATGTSVQIVADPRTDLQRLGFFSLEFSTVAGRTYYVQFLDSLTDAWSTSFSTVFGTGGPVRWVDTGPPVTTSLPTTARFYRVLEVQ
jgi:hypothetical protein